MGKKSRHQRPKKQKQPKEPEELLPTKAEPTFEICDAYNPGEETGIIFTSGNDVEPFNEFIALNVPRAISKTVRSLMNDFRKANDENIAHGHSVENGPSDSRFYVLLKLTQGDYKKKLLNENTLSTDPHHPLYELVPMFGESIAGHWGGREPAPGGEEEMVSVISKAWEKQFCWPHGGFILYIDGNRDNCDTENIKYIDLAVSLRNIQKWVVDWDIFLTPEQEAFVRKHSLYFYRFVKIIYRKYARCAQCGLIDMQQLQLCSRCKNSFYCCREHQVAGYPGHKEECQKWESLRNNKPTTEIVKYIPDKKGVRINNKHPEFERVRGLFEAQGKYLPTDGKIYKDLHAD